jgi:hypothetical protein
MGARRDMVRDLKKESFVRGCVGRMGGKGHSVTARCDWEETAYVSHL